MKKFIKSIEIESTIVSGLTLETWFRLGNDELALMLFDQESSRMHVTILETSEKILLEDYGEFCFWVNDTVDNDDLREALLDVAFERFNSGVQI